MVGSPGFSAGEIRQWVHEYELVPQGSKGAWLEDRSFSRHQMYRWRQAVFAGDLDRNLFPRQHGGMSSGQRRAFERARAKEIADHRVEVERLNARIRELEETADALGKAIGLLHVMREQEPDAPDQSSTSES